MCSSNQDTSNLYHSNHNCLLLGCSLNIVNMVKLHMVTELACQQLQHWVCLVNVMAMLYNDFQEPKQSVNALLSLLHKKNSKTHQTVST